jgi:ribonuclease-3
VSDLASFQTQLGFQFRDPALLRLALTHPSIAHEQGADLQHNQRLEFLGDAVLELAVTRELYEKFPGCGEGSLTQARAQMVNQRTLTAQSRRLGLGAHLILSRGEEQNGGRERPSILADAFEAVIGAVFLDAGYDAAREVVLRLFRGDFGELEVIPSLENPKGDLQELLQARSPESPEYRLVATSGPDHDRRFECTVHYRGEEIGRGTGRSKKMAESEAALAALEKLRSEAKP